MTLIDGSGFIYRAFHALPPLTTPDGRSVGALMGFVNMILAWQEMHQPTYGVIVFDHGRSLLRQEIFPEYKMHRPPTPPELSEQFDGIKEFCRAMNIAIVEKPGVEADDLIASIAHRVADQEWSVDVVTSDKDLLQIARDHVLMYDPLKKRTLDTSGVSALWGVRPDQIPDVQALAGDSADGIPGIPGIGIKTATAWIQEFGSLEGLISGADQLKTPKKQALVKEYADQARMCYQLALLRTSFWDESWSPDQWRWPEKPDALALHAFVHKYHLKVLADRLMRKGILLPRQDHDSTEPLPRQDHGSTEPLPRQDHGSALSPDPVSPHPVCARFDPLPASLGPQSGGGDISGHNHDNTVDAKTTGGAQSPLANGCDDSATPRMNRHAYGAENGEASRDRLLDQGMDAAPQTLPQTLPDLSHIDLNPHESQCPIILSQTIIASGSVALLMNDNTPLSIASLPIGTVRPAVLAYWGMGHWAWLTQETLALVWQDQSCTKIFHDFKQWVMAGFIDPQHSTHGPNDDLMILSYVLHGARHAHDLASIFHHAGWAQEIIETWSLQQKACAMVYVWEHSLIQLRQNRLLRAYYGLDRPVMGVLAKMEHCGIAIDRHGLDQLERTWTDELNALSHRITTLAGQHVNPASPKQLGKVLFEDLGWPNGKKGKSGAYQTDSDVLTYFSNKGYPLATALLEWRQLSKLINTYVKGLRDHINPKTHRIHTTYSITATSTGRLSSLAPNLQNIPIRTERGRLLRHQFRAPPGYGFLCLDYSQIELRLLAHMGPIPSLQQALRAHQDIHTLTAAHLFGCPPEDVTGDMRRTAKGINFGILYGISAFGLAQHLGIDRGLAKTMITNYFITYPEIHDYLERTKQEARQNGYVRTLWGRRCIIPGITSNHGAVRAGAERQAINAPLQGTSADIIKRAMIQIDAFLTRLSDTSRPETHPGVGHPWGLDPLEGGTSEYERGVRGERDKASGLLFDTPFGQTFGAVPAQKASSKQETHPGVGHPWGLDPLTAHTPSGLHSLARPQEHPQEHQLERLLEHPQDVALLLQIHDALVFQVRCQDAKALGNMLVPMMEHVAQLSVPLSVTSTFGLTLDQ